MGLWNWVWRRGGSGEGFQLTFLISWPAQLMFSQGKSSGVEGLENWDELGKEGLRTRSL